MVVITSYMPCLSFLAQADRTAFFPMPASSYSLQDHLPTTDGLRTTSANHLNHPCRESYTYMNYVHDVFPNLALLCDFVFFLSRFCFRPHHEHFRLRYPCGRACMPHRLPVHVLLVLVVLVVLVLVVLVLVLVVLLLPLLPFLRGRRCRCRLAKAEGIARLHRATPKAQACSGQQNADGHHCFFCAAPKAQACTCHHCFFCAAPKAQACTGHRRRPAAETQAG
jgi:hypothetical protein